MTDVVSHDSETPAHGQQVFTACALIHHDFDKVTKVFLCRRAHNKKFYPDVYEMPGGHVDFGETMPNGLKREIMEELGMSLSLGDPLFEFTYANQVKGSHSIEVVYFAKFVEPIDQVTLQAQDHSEAGWFAEPEIDEIMKAGRAPGDGDEAKAIKKGFALLKGESLDFG